MGTIVLRPTADGYTQTWTATGQTSHFQNVWHGIANPTDSEYNSDSTGAEQYIFANLPSNADEVTQLRVRVRHNSSNPGKGDSNRTLYCRCGKNLAGASPTYRTTNMYIVGYVATATNSAWVTLPLTGGNIDASDWVDFGTEFSIAGNEGTKFVYEVELEVTFSEKNVGTPYATGSGLIAHQFLALPYENNNPGLARDVVGNAHGEFVVPQAGYNAPPVFYSSRGPVADLWSGTTSENALKVPGNQLQMSTTTQDLPHSWMLWAYIQGPDANERILYKGRNTTWETEYSFIRHSSGDMYVHLMDSQKLAYLRYAAAAPGDGWVHYCFTYDGSGLIGGGQLYVNGLASGQTGTLESSASGSDTYGQMRPSNDDLIIGGHFVPGFNDGPTLQDVRFYRHQMSAAEVLDAYQKTVRDPFESVRKQPSIFTFFPQEGGGPAPNPGVRVPRGNGRPVIHTFDIGRDTVRMTDDRMWGTDSEGRSKEMTKAEVESLVSVTPEEKVYLWSQNNSVTVTGTTPTSLISLTGGGGDQALHTASYVEGTTIKFELSGDVEKNDNATTSYGLIQLFIDGSSFMNVQIPQADMSEDGAYLSIKGLLTFDNITSISATVLAELSATWTNSVTGETFYNQSYAGPVGIAVEDGDIFDITGDFSADAENTLRIHSSYAEIQETV